MPTRADLTEKQQAVYSYIVQYIRNNGYAPSIREMQTYFKYYSSNSIAIHLDNLERKGYITRAGIKDGQKARTIRLVDDMMGIYTVDSKTLAKAMFKLRERKYNLHHNEAVELLKELGIKLV